MSRTRLLLVLVVITLGVIGVWRHRTAAAAQDSPVKLATGQPAETGTFPDQWIAGLDCGLDPAYQVHAYNGDFYIIRQSKCLHFEAPFMYLIFGDEKALLMDTGSILTGPVAATVDGVVQEWLKRNRRESIPLIVAHTHSHGDHVQGDVQLSKLPYVEQVVGLGQAAVEQFWGFQDYPNDIVQFDLGNRVLDVIGTPGHHPASVTLYDRRTQLLMTGDTVYPGHIFVFAPQNMDVLRLSFRRLLRFAERNPVEWVVGCHIEMSATPGVSFAWGTPAHPDEHVLEFRPSILQDMHNAMRTINRTDPDGECRIFDEFVIHAVYECGITWNGE